MKLIKEMVDYKDLQIIKEDSVDTGKKHFKLKGVFLEAEIKNRNGRIYPRPILEREVKKYNEEYIKTNRAIGELDHGETPSINLDRISHVVESLVMEGNKGIGVLRLIDTPMGKIAQTLVSEGILLGVSTRGVGSLDENNNVKSDYIYVCQDLVFEPSCQSAMMETVLENEEWIIGEHGWMKLPYDNLKKSVDKKYNSSDSQLIANYLTTFINQIKIK